MNSDLLTALRALSAPGAVLEWRNYTRFGFREPLVNVMPSGDSVDWADFEDMNALCYIDLAVERSAWNHDYVISSAGRAALEEMERETDKRTANVD